MATVSQGSLAVAMFEEPAAFKPWHVKLRETARKQPIGVAGALIVILMILMAIFLVGGSIGLLADWPAGPYNLDWGVWVVLYGGYGYVIGAAIFHARTGR